MTEEAEKARVTVKKAQKAPKRGPGVVYLSRVPPYMKPAKVKHLLGQFGAVSRVYLAPEDAAVARRRAKLGTNKAKNFTEGWIEFADRRIAKRCAESLNATPMGGDKRDYYAQDLWNLKFLRGFTWTHLTEKVAYERRVAAAQQRVAVDAVRRENADFLDRVDKREKMKQHRDRTKNKKTAAPSSSSSSSSREIVAQIASP